MLAAATLPPLSGASLDLRQVDPLRSEHWDDLILTHPQATVFHSRGWAQVLAATYGYNPEYFLAEDNRRVHALLPLFEVRSWLTGLRGVSLPFTDRCDCLYSEEVPFRVIFNEALKYGREQQWSYLEVRGGPEDFAEPSALFHEHQLDLTASPEVLMEKCDSSMRRAIRKAEKADIRVAVSTAADAMETYYRLHVLTRRKHGIPPQPVKFFRNIHRYLIAKGFGKILLAFEKDIPVAAAIFLHLGTSSIYKFGASDPASQENRPNNLLLLKGILAMKELGAEVLSLGRTSLNQEGLRRFKLGLGADESSLRYIRYDFRSNGFSRQRKDNSTGWHARLFRFCPAFASKLVGAAIYPHLG